MGFTPKVERDGLLTVIEENSSVTVACITHGDGDGVSSSDARAACRQASIC